MSGLEELQNVTTSVAQSKTNQENIFTEIKKSDKDWYVPEAITFVGMNTDGVSVGKMKSHVFTYVDDVDAAVQNLETKASAAKAFGPDVAKQVENYVIQMKEAILAITSNLKRFAADIDNVATAYRAKGESIISDVQTTSTNIGTAASSNKYTYESGTTGSNRSN